MTCFHCNTRRTTFCASHCCINLDTVPSLSNLGSFVDQYWTSFVEIATKRLPNLEISPDSTGSMKTRGKKFYPKKIVFDKGIVLLFLQGKNAQDRPENPQNGYLAKFGRKMIDEIMKSTPWRPYLGNVWIIKVALEFWFGDPKSIILVSKMGKSEGFRTTKMNLRIMRKYMCIIQFFQQQKKNPNGHL